MRRVPVGVTPAKRTIQLLQLGFTKYSDALEIQNSVAEQVRLNPDDPSRQALILTEHAPVYTVGIRADRYPKEEANRLRSLGAEFEYTNRGGLITFHGPGQLVAYPILNLKNFTPSVRWYVHSLESTVLELCKRCGVPANTSPHTGVWVRNKKVAAIGVQCKQMITMHGIAVNCNVDLRWFLSIVPCGLEGKEVTSLSQELRRNFTVQEAAESFTDCFEHVFDCALVKCENNVGRKEGTVKEEGTRSERHKESTDSRITTDTSELSKPRTVNQSKS